MKPHSWLIALAGFAIGLFWQRLIGSYRNLGTATFEVIHQMEECLCFRPYRTEWTFLEEGNNRKKYLPLTHFEIWIPRIFAVAMLFLAGWTSPWAVDYRADLRVKKQKSTPAEVSPAAVKPAN